MTGADDIWEPTGLGTRAARSSKPLHELGSCLVDSNYINLKHTSDRADIAASGVQMLVLQASFERYVYFKQQQFHDAAVRFLVMLASMTLGAQGIKWNWREVRLLARRWHLSVRVDLRGFERDRAPAMDMLAQQLLQLAELALR